MSDSTWLYRRHVSVSPSDLAPREDVEPQWRQQQQQQKTWQTPSTATPDSGGSEFCSQWPPPPPPPRPQQRYLLLLMRRPSLSVPWGLTLCRPQDGGGTALVVVVGEARPTAVRIALVECREQCGATIGPDPFISSGGGEEGTAATATATATAYVQRWSAFLRRQPPVVGAAATLLPGDWILAVDGRCPWALASSLQELTALLRGRRSLRLLVYRHDTASNAAARALRQTRDAPVGTMSPASRVTTTAAPTPARRAADASYRVIRALFPQVVTPSPTPTTSPLASLSPPPGTTKYYQPELPSWEGHPTTRPAARWNPIFTDDKGYPIPFDDDDHHECEMEVIEAIIHDSDRSSTIKSAMAGDDGTRPPSPAGDFAPWLLQRKRSWRERRRGRAFADEVDDASVIRGDCGVAVDFWSLQGDASFGDWLARSTHRWRRSFSWNRRKRRKLEEELEQQIVLCDNNFGEWLRVRKNQWLIQRRKRHRRRLESAPPQGAYEATPKPDATVVSASNVDFTAPMGGIHPDVAIVDAILDDQDMRRKACQSRGPLDLAVFFDRNVGLPDDIVAHMIGFLKPMDRPHLLAINQTIRRDLCNRQEVWRQLCESHWKVPRKPRKPWHEIYFATHRFEVEYSRIKIDGLLTRAADILFKADNLQAIEKLVTTAEQNDAFNVNHSSGVVCERNSLLNLAVIHRRHKVVRWLVEIKCADIETSDRGRFTPLMNAAWAGDRYLVRFFMQKGADRWKLGTSHYTKPLAAPDFQGLDAAGWADKRGHPEIATLIRRGL